MQRAVDQLGELLVGGDRHEQVRRLHADLELVEVLVLQHAGMEQGAVDHGVGAGLAVLFQQLAFQGAGVDADAHGTAVVAGGLDDLLDPRLAADVARIDPQAGRAGLGRLDAAFVVEVDVRDDRHVGGLGDRRHGGRRLLVRARDPHDVGPSLLKLADLGDGRRRIRGEGVGHRLHGDGRIAPNRHVADMDLARFAPVDRPPGAHVGVIFNAHDTPRIG